MERNRTPANNVLELVGNTPMVRLRSLPTPQSADIFAKCEQLNPGGSVKDRVAKAMIEAAEQQGKIGPGSVIIEPTSGNTGIGLALTCVTKGYRCVLTMPEDMSLERRELLRSYGAELMLTPAASGMYVAMEIATELCAKDSRYYMPMQFSNAANPQIHRETTAPEILAALGDRPIDAFVCGVGTGGTITGVGQVLRQRYPNILIVAVEPKGSPVLSGGKPGPHKIQGIGAGFVPEVVDTTLFNEIMTVEDTQAIRTREMVMRREGLSVGISAGANVFAALDVGERLGPGACVVTVLCDTGERYLSTTTRR
ncbi:MAG: cysteine synthase A [Myxococcales bacterium]|nr:cysteine synthase A [Myxococcales bacterium]